MKEDFKIYNKCNQGAYDQIKTDKEKPSCNSRGMWTENNMKRTN